MKYIFLVLIFILNCSETGFRADPASLTLNKIENKSTSNYVLLGHAGDDCTVLRHKRIHTILFFVPLNDFSKEEQVEISNQKMIRYKNILRPGDFFWNLLFPLTSLTYTIEVETCSTGMVAVSKKEYFQNKIKQINKNSDEETQDEKDSTQRKTKLQIEDEDSVSKEKVTIPKESNFPIIKNYLKNIDSSDENGKPNTILFSKNNADLEDVEIIKLDNFSEDYNKKYSKFKILLIGHSEWSNGKGRESSLSEARAESVKEYLLTRNIPEENILLGFAGGRWGEKKEEKLGKKLSRRVDIILLE